MTPQRIQRRRTKGFRLPPGCVYVGRPTKWGSPFPVRCMVSQWRGYHELIGPITPEQSVEFFRLWLAGDRSAPWSGFSQGQMRPTVQEIVAALAGKNLACFCPLDQPCHADVLLEIANGRTP